MISDIEALPQNSDPDTRRDMLIKSRQKPTNPSSEIYV